MSTNIRVEKICHHCNKIFIAQKLSTRYCSPVCNKRAYKARKKLEKLTGVEEPPKAQAKTDLPKPAPTFLLELQDKQFLTVSEVAKLLRLSKATIYRLIKEKKISAVQFSQRATRIKRTEIDNLFTK